MVDEIKAVPCMDCGNSYPSCVMDFDHREDKLMDVGRLVGHGYSIKRILAEIEKCDIICANCHRIRTHMQRIETIQDLLDFTVEKYSYYAKIFQANRDSVTVYYVKDFMNDLLLIQRFASKENDISGEGRETSSPNVS